VGKDEPSGGWPDPVAKVLQLPFAASAIGSAGLAKTVDIVETTLSGPLRYLTGDRS
jgi:hypothetical protein